jgi:hypothetical protein
MNWGHVVMSAPRLWEPDRDGPKPTCDYVGCRDLVDMLLGFGTMSCGCEWPWHSEGER